jgi:uncharacterized protein YcgI (DUF1989 family)
MKKIVVGLVVGLLVAGVLAVAGCGGEPEVEGYYLNPEGGKLRLKADDTMSLIKVAGTAVVKGTYEVQDDELSLYSSDKKTNKAVMTFRIREGKVLELIDVTGLIWVQQSPE